MINILQKCKVPWQVTLEKIPKNIKRKTLLIFYVCVTWMETQACDMDVQTISCEENSIKMKFVIKNLWQQMNKKTKIMQFMHKGWGKLCYTIVKLGR